MPVRLCESHTDLDLGCKYAKSRLLDKAADSGSQDGRVGPSLSLITGARGQSVAVVDEADRGRGQETNIPPYALVRRPRRLSAIGQRIARVKNSYTTLSPNSAMPDAQRTLPLT
jgi:hypothetical protein